MRALVFTLAAASLLFLADAALADGKVPTRPKVAPDRVSAAHIIISHKEASRVPPGVTRTKEEARKRAEEALAYARRADVKWADAVARYSDDPNTKGNGGVIGMLTKGQLQPQFKPLEDALFGMEEGQVSDIVETPIGFHILSRRKIVEYAAAHILIQFAGSQRSRASRTKDEALALAKQILAEIQGGADFAAMARKHSDGPSGPKGGDLGIFGAGQMVPPFEQALAKLKIGEVSGVVETPFGYHLILRKKIDRVGAAHILIQYQGSMRAKPTVTRSKDEAKKLAEDLLAKAKAGGDFAALAREHSDGPSGPAGGSLGIFGRGQMVPAFEKVVFGLEVGGVGFCETQFGFHVIKRTR